MKQIKFLIEEYHRGLWQPLMLQGSNNKIQRRVFITQDEADTMNINSFETGLRYVKATEVKDVEVVDAEVVAENDIKERYIALYGKKPFHGWNDEKILEKINSFKKD